MFFSSIIFRSHVWTYDEDKQKQYFGVLQKYLCPNCMVLVDNWPDFQERHGHASSFTEKKRYLARLAALEQVDDNVSEETVSVVSENTQMDLPIQADDNVSEATVSVVSENSDHEIQADDDVNDIIPAKKARIVQPTVDLDRTPNDVDERTIEPTVEEKYQQQIRNLIKEKQSLEELVVYERNHAKEIHLQNKAHIDRLQEEIDNLKKAAAAADVSVNGQYQHTVESIRQFFNDQWQNLKCVDSASAAYTLFLPWYSKQNQQ